MITIELFVLKDNMKRLVTGPVAVPGCPDCDHGRGEKILSVDEIEDMVHWYNTFSRKSDVMHTYSRNGNTIGDTVENWTLKQPMTVKNILGETKTYPVGTWMATTKVTDNETWNKIQDGTLRGYSATYMSEDMAIENFVDKRTLIADLDNPVPVLVSIVDNPCVEDAIFCSIKKPPEPDSEIQDVLYKSEKAGRKISNATLKPIKEAFENIQKLINDALMERGELEADKKEDIMEDVDMDKEEIQEMINESVKAALKELQEVTEPEPAPDVEPEPEPEPSEAEPSEAEKQLEEANKRIKELEKKLGEGESQSIKGQDDTPVDDEVVKHRIPEGRDGMGRRIRK